jgi:sulfopyruvate decarboxylase TPP-binding subunit
MDAKTDSYGASTAAWQHELYDLLRRNGITQFCYVPDAGHAILIDRSLADPDAHSIALTTEEEGVALCAGADLGGERAVLLMQSSGVGNCINMLSLIKGGHFPFLTLVSMRGDFGEGNPWQYAMGQATPAVLEAMGVIVLRVEREEGGARRGRRRAHHGVQGRPVRCRVADPAADWRQTVLSTANGHDSAATQG